MLRIKFKDKVLQVNSASFSKLSTVSASYVHGSFANEICVPDNHQNQHFDVLMLYLKNGDDVIKHKPLALLSISISWKCSELINKIQNISLSLGDKSLILDEIVIGYNRKCNLVILESNIMNNFVDYIKETKERMITLNVELLKRLLPWYLDTSVNFNEIIDFLLLVLNKQGSGASCLFQYINFEQVKLEKVIELIQNKTFEQKYIMNQMVTMIGKYENELNALEEKLKKSDEKVQELEKSKLEAIQIFEEKENMLIELQQQLLIVNSSIELSSQICEFDTVDGTDELLRLKYIKHLKNSELEEANVDNNE